MSINKNGLNFSVWRLIFILTAVLQIAGVVMFFLIMSLAVQRANVGIAGTEYIEIILYRDFVPLVAVVALVSLISFLFYAVRYRPSGKKLFISILSFLVSLILVVYGAYATYQYRVVLPKYINQLSEQSDQKAGQMY